MTAKCIGAILSLFALTALPGEPDAPTQQLRTIARAERVAFRLAYEQHARYRFPASGRTANEIATTLRIPEDDLSGLTVTADEKHWRVAGEGLFITDAKSEEPTLPQLTARLGPYDAIEAAREAHQRLEDDYDLPLARALDTPRLLAGAITFYQQMTMLLRMDMGMDAFRADETKLTIRRIASRLARGDDRHVHGILDEWGSEIRVQVSDDRKHYTITSPGADRQADAAQQSAALGDPRNDLTLRDGQWIRTATLADILNWYTSKASTGAMVHKDGEPYRIGGDVLPPVVIERVDPTYTPEARAAHVKGLLIVEAIIDKSGAVTDVHVLKSLHPSFDDNAVKAIRQWKYKPAVLKGEPVAVYLTLTIAASEE